VLTLGVAAAAVPLIAWIHKETGGFVMLFVVLAVLAVAAALAAALLPGKGDGGSVVLEKERPQPAE